MAERRTLLLGVDIGTFQRCCLIRAFSAGFDAFWRHRHPKVGIAVFVAGIRNISRAATPVRGTKPTRVLVTTGIHGWTRNAIGMFLIYDGIGLAVCSPWILVLTLFLAITIRYGFVAREEACLERRFGDVYRNYKVRVRRWV